jgi:bifunctional non-homologous end joining protein LigD
MEGDGPTVFAHACKLGLEGIVSKRKNSPYRSGRSPEWLKMKNADAPP